MITRTSNHQQSMPNNDHMTSNSNHITHYDRTLLDQLLDHGNINAVMAVLTVIQTTNPNARVTGSLHDATAYSGTLCLQQLLRLIPESGSRAWLRTATRHLTTFSTTSLSSKARRQPPTTIPGHPKLRPGNDFLLIVPRRTWKRHNR